MVSQTHTLPIIETVAANAAKTAMAETQKQAPVPGDMMHPMFDINNHPIFNVDSMLRNLNENSFHRETVHVVPSERAKQVVAEVGVPEGRPQTIVRGNDSLRVFVRSLPSSPLASQCKSSLRFLFFTRRRFLQFLPKVASCCKFLWYGKAKGHNGKLREITRSKGELWENDRK